MSAEIKARVKGLVHAVAGANPDNGLIEEMLETILRLAGEKNNRGDLKLVNSTLKEMRYAFNVFSQYKEVPKVTAFGSARIGPETAEYKMAREFSRKMAQQGFMIITGAAGGIMRACNEGAGIEKSFGINIRLPFEQKANEFIAADKLINFKYFFTRKLIFVKESDAIALFPGGFGTLDEAFELFTLVQTGKSNPRPIVLLDVPGGGYWAAWENYIRDHCIKKGLVSSTDLHLYFLTQDVDAAVEEITSFYRVYHSSRYVGKKMILRLKKDVSDQALTKMNREFKSILAEGQIERTNPLSDEVEDKDHLSFPRLMLTFNHRDFGLLRQLINHLNEVV